jgi:hypothetical protein
VKGFTVGLFRRRRLPADRKPKLDRDERIVAWAGATGDDVVVATNLGLWLPGAAERLGWHEIHKATWSGRQLALVAARPVADSGDYTVMEDLPALVVTLLDPDRVPEQVQARVIRSVAYTSHHALPEGGGVRVVARRVSGANGVRWTVRYDNGSDATAPGVPEATGELVAQAKISAVW